MRRKISLLFFLVVLFYANATTVQEIKELKVSKKRIATLEVLTDEGKFEYHLDNTGEKDVSKALQFVFDEVAAQKDVSASFNFLPGVYYINAPIVVNIASLELVGNGHAGLDIHGANVKTGCIFKFGKETGPNCITFNKTAHSKSFPAGESPWPHKNSKVGVTGLTFMGYNNTGVNTADGYSRFRGDEPNFRGLHWYPSADRYTDIEKEGQRALVFPKGKGKNEMLKINSCVFTDLYVGVEVQDFCDVSFITDSWFAQLVYGIRMSGMSPVCMIKNNCFADLETGMVLGHLRMSNLNGNTFAYVSKCFDVANAEYSTISNNTVHNWKLSTGAAAHGLFCSIGKSSDLVMTGNTVRIELDARAKKTTVDTENDGRSFVDFRNSKNLIFSNNVLNTQQTQTVVRLHNSQNCLISNNIITYAKGGNAVAETGNSKANTYVNPQASPCAAFDEYKY